MNKFTFEQQLAISIATAFSAATDLGCSITSRDGSEALFEAGRACSGCALCEALGRDALECAHTHLYGMTEAERFGGRYIYFCKRGLTFFTSPIIGRDRGEAKLTVGPFLMVEEGDFIDCELAGEYRLPREELSRLVRGLPHVPPERVTALSQLLFMSVGFLNNISASERMREQEVADAIQGRMNAYILENKDDFLPYPYEKERALLEAIRARDRQTANELLNELLGHILLLSGAAVDRMKSRVFELMVVISRAAVEGGADISEMQDRTHLYFQRLQNLQGMPSLCRWLAAAMNEMIGAAFHFGNLKHAGAINRVERYIEANLTEKLDMERLAKLVFLSPDYFARIFREETGLGVQQYIISARLRCAEEMMRSPNLKLSEIAALTGFADQSHFSRLFLKEYGMSPSKYRHRLMR